MKTRLVHIEDDFDLEKIARSGQCFRAKAVDDGWYRFIARDKVLYIRKSGARTGDAPSGPGLYEVTSSEEEWRNFWSHYFDLDRCYSEVRGRCIGKSNFVDETMRIGKGLRVLNQDPWEMLVTFIISQRKSIPAISGAVEKLSEKLGRPIESFAESNSESETDNANASASESTPLHAFPTPEQIYSATDDELSECSLGYRVPYVRAAAEMVLSGELDLETCAQLPDEELFEELQRVHGVGKKVANCVCLFGFGRTQMVPVDVWIARAIQENMEGEDPFEQFGTDAGLMQQYVFYYMTQHAKP